jgi:hypothetical protein
MAREAKAVPQTALVKRAPQSVSKWDDELAREAQEQASKESVGSPRLSVRGGLFNIGGSPLKDREISVIVMDHVFENVYYPGKFDPDNKASPVCYAFGRDAESMVPHEKSPEPQAESCAACPHNVFGSAETGRGKACKNSKRLLVVSADNATPESVAQGEALVFNVPVTSVRGWAMYVKGLASNYRRPPYAVITEVAVEPDPSTQFKIAFRYLGLLGDEFASAISARRSELEGVLETAYPPPREQPAAPPVAPRKRKRGREKF